MDRSMINPPAVVKAAEQGLAALAAKINAAHADAGASLRAGLEQAKAAGELLLKAKAQMPHGRWGPWLKGNLRFSERTAQGYMRIAREWQRLNSNPQRVADLPYRGALELLAQAAPQRDEGQAEPPPAPEAAPQVAGACPATPEPAAAAGPDAAPDTYQTDDDYDGPWYEGAGATANPGGASPPENPRPAAGRASPAEPGAAPRDERASEPAGGALVDALGVPVPQRLTETFAARAGFREAVGLLREATRVMTDLAQAPGGERLRARLQMQEKGGRRSYHHNGVDDALRTLKFSVPHSATCPYCEYAHPGRVNPGCRCCSGLGWVEDGALDNAPPEYRAAVLALRRPPAEGKPAAPAEPGAAEKAREAFGKLVRGLDRLGLFERHRPALDALGADLHAATKGAARP